MNEKAPFTATEIGIRMSQETRRELLNWLVNGEGLEGREITLNIGHYDTGELGTVTAVLKDFKLKSK